MKHPQMTQQEETLPLTDFVAAEAELQELKDKYQIEDNKKKSIWVKIGDAYVDYKERKQPVSIEKKKYCLTALFLGWLGVHQFMIGRKVTGILYLVTCWTGISLALSALDIFQAAFMKVDENNLITLP